MNNRHNLTNENQLMSVIVIHSPSSSSSSSSHQMARRSVGVGRREEDSPSLLTRMVTKVFSFLKFAEFEILFVSFFLIVYLIFKDLTSRPEYNQLLVKKPGGPDWWNN